MVTLGRLFYCRNETLGAIRFYAYTD